MIAPDAAEMSTVLASSIPRYPLRMLRPTRPTSARTAQIRSMFHPLSGQPLDPVDGRVRRLRVRAVVRHGRGPGGLRVDRLVDGRARVRGPGDLRGRAARGGAPLPPDLVNVSCDGC